MSALGCGIMNGFFLLVPFLLIRYVLLNILDKRAVSRAAYFAPVQGKEKIAYYFYQIATVGIFVCPFFLKVRADFSWQFFIGTACYLLGLGLCVVSMIDFASPDDTGLNTAGIYRISRNPMYVAYFICFAGIAFLTKSRIMFAVLAIFQISAHWIILAEERWCLEKFGETYREYMKRVRRYI